MYSWICLFFFIFTLLRLILRVGNGQSNQQKFKFSAKYLNLISAGENLLMLIYLYFFSFLEKYQMKSLICAKNKLLTATCFNNNKIFWQHQDDRAETPKHYIFYKKVNSLTFGRIIKIYLRKLILINSFNLISLR